jgi:hypothetical protein
MRLPPLRFTVRTLVVAVAMLAAVFGAYMSGWRDSQKVPRDPAREKALQLVRSMPITSDEQGCAVFGQALRHERKTPGFRAEFTRVTSKSLGGQRKWATIFVSSKTGMAYEDHGTLDDFSIAEYRKLISAK